MNSVFSHHTRYQGEASRSPLPLGWCILLAVLGGAMMFAAFPPLNMGMFVWVGLIPLLSALWTGKRRRGRKGFLTCLFLGWVFGLVYYGGSFWWINEVSTLGFIPMVMYLALYPALWAGLMGTSLRPRMLTPPLYDHDRSKRLAEWKVWCRMDMRSTVVSAICGAALWVCVEWLRGWGVTGFGWNSLGVALYDGLSFAQWAEYVGVNGVAFIPVMVGIWLWRVGRRLGVMLLREGKRTVPWDFFAMALILMGLFLGGMLSSIRFAPDEARDRSVPVMAVQRDHSQQYKWDPNNASSIYLEMAVSTGKGILDLREASIERAAATGESRLDQPAWVIWPESSFPTSTMYSMETGELFTRSQNNVVFLGKEGYINSVKEESDSDFILIAGCDEAYWNKEGKAGKILNTLSAFETDFSSKKTYAKTHLVPFGEYIPLRTVFPILEKAFEFSAGSAMGSNFTPGTSFEPLVLPISPGSEATVGVIPAVCFEDTVGSLMRKFVRHGSQVIVNVTNDGWFNHSWANEQHWRNAAFRCIELRRSMIRAANTGVTVALAPNGAVIASLRNESGSPFVQGHLFARLPLTHQGETLYAILGDWFVGLCAVIAICCFLAQRKRRKSA